MIESGKQYRIKGESTYFLKKYGTSNPDIVVEETDRQVFGKSWGFVDGNPACLIYATRSAFENLPNDDVYYGHIVGGFGELVHESELQQEVPDAETQEGA